MGDILITITKMGPMGKMQVHLVHLSSDLNSVVVQWTLRLYTFVCLD